ncbi:MAG: DNA polymerase I [Leptospirillum sp.]|jgi:DNA polymerase-1
MNPSPRGTRSANPGDLTWASVLPKNTLYLLDGFGYIFRAYHSRVDFTNSKGCPTGAFTVFANMLLSVVRDFNPAYLGVIFEGQGKSVRSEILPQIKANRPSPPEDFLVQIPYIERLIAGLGISTVSVDGYEADDVIATLAHRWIDQAQGDSHVVVMSADKDLLNVVSDRVTVFDPMTKKRFGVSEVIDRWGVLPSQIPDLLALMGDTSDNIPGVPGVGPVTAAKLLGRSGDGVEELLSRIDSVTPPRIRDLLVEHRERILLSKKVTILHDRLPIEASPDSLSLSCPDFVSLEALLKDLEAPALWTRIRSLENRDPKTKAPDPSANAPIPSSMERSHTLSSDVLAQKHGIDPVSPNEIWYHGSDRSLLFSKSDLDGLKKILTGLSEPVWVSDSMLLHRHWPELILPEVAFDLVLAAYLLDPGHREDSLSVIASRHFLNVDGERRELVSGLYPLLYEEISRFHLLPVLLKIEVPLSGILSKMERLGVSIDKGQLEALRHLLSGRLSALEKEVHELAGESFLILSPKQVARILFEKLALPTARKGKTGFSTDEETLESLRSKHPLPGMILEYRQLSKLLSTYVEGISSKMDENGRLHGQFHQTVTATGRLSSSDPNLQNIPIRSELGLEIRKCFVAAPGSLLLSADYSQIELRLLAHMSGDGSLVEAFTQGEDIHSNTARRLFGEPVTPDSRRRAKTVNFGILYGMSSYSLAQSLGVTASESKEVIDRYFATYPGIEPFFSSILDEARKTGMVRTISGRIRRIPEVLSSDRRLREYGERMAVNTVLQGSAADLIKKSMVDLSRRLDALPDKGANLLIQVHDELLLEVPSSMVEEISVLLKEVMEKAFDLNVPLVVSTGWGKNWVDAHPA